MPLRFLQDHRIGEQRSKLYHIWVAMKNPTKIRRKKNSSLPFFYVFAASRETIFLLLLLPVLFLFPFSPRFPSLPPPRHPPSPLEIAFSPRHVIPWKCAMRSFTSRFSEYTGSDKFESTEICDSEMSISTAISTSEQDRMLSINHWWFCLLRYTSASNTCSSRSEVTFRSSTWKQRRSSESSEIKLTPSSNMNEKCLPTAPQTRSPKFVWVTHSHTHKHTFRREWKCLK